MRQSLGPSRLFPCSSSGDVISARVLQDFVRFRKVHLNHFASRRTPTRFRAVGGGAAQVGRLMVSSRLGPRWLLVAVVLASGLYVRPFVDKGWVPHDEGLLGQSAERVLAGQLPHRDFDEVYTGGLSYLHALAFKLGGVRSIVLRWM